MLLPGPDRSPLRRSQLFGPTAALYSLCRNGKSRATLPRLGVIFFGSNLETLRKKLLGSEEYAEFKRVRYDETLYPKSRAIQSENR